ncbi:hypothetical protein A9Q81_14750 [Gammaproteobacteria bacterium 42_54_T18]|nr:hypothetical protein A9Q81_14750 [Gammaproteobacteria bacterium 42_54_T18]
MKHQILVLEDDPDIRRGIVIELNNTQRYDVIQTECLGDALLSIQQNLPSVAIVDIMMSGDDNAGLTFIKTLQEKNLLHKIAVIILSAKNSADDILNALAQGAIDYLTKPYDPEILINRVQRATTLISQKNVENKTPELKSRKNIVESMTLALSYWELTTGRSKLHFADESKLWSIYVDKKGTCSTKTLDKYLQLSTLPKKPKINNVQRSIQFALDHCDEHKSSHENVRKKLITAHADIQSNNTH